MAVRFKWWVDPWIQIISNRYYVIFREHTGLPNLDFQAAREQDEEVLLDLVRYEVYDLCEGRRVDVSNFEKEYIKILMPNIP
jgi:hypothetical protein